MITPETNNTLLIPSRLYNFTIKANSHAYMPVLGPPVLAHHPSHTYPLANLVRGRKNKPQTSVSQSPHNHPLATNHRNHPLANNPQNHPLITNPQYMYGSPPAPALVQRVVVPVRATGTRLNGGQVGARVLS